MEPAVMFLLVVDAYDSDAPEMGWKKEFRVLPTEGMVLSLAAAAAAPNTLKIYSITKLTTGYVPGTYDHQYMQIVFTGGCLQLVDIPEVKEGV